MFFFKVGVFTAMLLFMFLYALYALYFPLFRKFQTVFLGKKKKEG